eukprot:7232085-Prymnesium_polylepis.1
MVRKTSEPAARTRRCATNVVPPTSASRSHSTDARHSSTSATGKAWPPESSTGSPSASSPPERQLALAPRSATTMLPPTARAVTSGSSSAAPPLPSAAAASAVSPPMARSCDRSRSCRLRR